MRFKIIHPESDDEWIEEFETEDEAYEKYNQGYCSVIPLKDTTPLRSKASNNDKEVNEDGKISQKI